MHFIVLTTLGEQLLWTEQSGPENLDPIVWPRAASSAEVGFEPHSKSKTDFQRRFSGLERLSRTVLPGMLIQHYLVYTI